MVKGVSEPVGITKPQGFRPCGFVAFGGDKRDRTADLLNAIDGRGSVRQGQALQKEKPLKYKGFFLICPFRTLYFSASCALEFLNRLRVCGAAYSPISFTLR